jgi:hypothetical protein
MKPFFVMLISQKQDILIPLMDENGELAMFDTEHEANKFAADNPMGQAFGFIVYEV